MQRLAIKLALNEQIPKAPRLTGKTRKLDLVDVMARAITAICLLNLNGVITMMFGFGQAMSGAMLILSLALIVWKGLRIIAGPAIFFVVTVAIYLIIGNATYSTLNSIIPVEEVIRNYLAALLLFWSLATYVASLNQPEKVERFIRFFRSVSIISASSILLSPWLVGLYVNMPVQAEFRMSGFFMNPNEAGCIANLALGLLLTKPFQNRILQVVAIGIAVVATVLTFSKTAIAICLLILTLWALLSIRKWSVAIVWSLLLIGVLTVDVDPKGITAAVVDQDVIELDNNQVRRILAIGDILAGEIDESTSTGRTELWKITLDRAMEHFFFGQGLGSQHRIVGGVMTKQGEWLGSHNVFLLFFGEAGIFAVLSLVATLGFALANSIRSRSTWPAFFCLMIIVSTGMSTHGLLNLSFVCAALGLSYGLLAAKAMKCRSQLSLNGRRSARLYEKSIANAQKFRNTF